MTERGLRFCEPFPELLGRRAAALTPEHLTQGLSKLDAAQPGKTQLYVEIPEGFDLGKPLARWA